MKRKLLLVFLMLSLTSIAQADPVSSTLQRMQFWAAKRALKNNDLADFMRLEKNLQDYPLYPYLAFDYLNLNLKKVNETEINDFLMRYSDTPLAERLRDNWLKFLSSQNRSTTFLKFYRQSSNTEINCLYLQTLIQTKQTDLIQNQQDILWNTGATQPATCENAFVNLYENRLISDQEVWQRIKLAYEKNNFSLVEKLKSWLPEPQQALVVLWQRIISDPLLIEQSNLFLPLSHYSKDVLLDGIKRLARKDPQQAASIWAEENADYDLDHESEQTAIYSIGLGLAHDADTDAYNYFDQLDEEREDQSVQEWRVRLALATQNWQQVIYWIDELSPEYKQQTCWQYWLARALAATNHNAEANAIYQKLMHQTNYYALLSAQQLHKTFTVTENSQQISSQTIAAVENMPSIQRAYELYNLQLIPEARREWQWSMNKMTVQEKMAAAQLAYNWGWYDRAFYTAKQTNQAENAHLLFPQVYQTTITGDAQQYQLNPAWIMAIIRQESGFTSDVKSPVGALGLMQLLPSTAQHLSASNQTNSNRLLNPDINIEYGSHYLHDLFAQYNFNVIDATAAYNLGPTRLQKWLPLQKKLPADIWVEILPWQETRDYVKSVLLATYVYQNQLQV